jgi:hypothetical protein
LCANTRIEAFKTLPVDMKNVLQLECLCNGSLLLFWFYNKFNGDS